MIKINHFNCHRSKIQWTEWCCNISNVIVSLSVFSREVDHIINKVTSDFIEYQETVLFPDV